MKNRFIQLSALLVFLLGSSVSQAQEQADFYDVGAIQIIDIKFEQKEWRYILDSLRFNGDAVLIGDVTINGKRIEDAGVRYRGTRAFQPGGKRNGMDVLLNYVDQNTNYQGYQTIVLSSALRDPSMVREVLGFEVARRYMLAPGANYAKVTVNGELFGIMVNVEAVDAAFTKRHFGDDARYIFRSAPKIDERAPAGCRSNIFGSLQVDNSADCYRQNYRLEWGTGGFDPIFNLAKFLNEKPEEMPNFLDVDRALWMLAFNNVLLNLNSYTGQYSSNYYLIRDKAGRFAPVLWDLNLAFGSYKNTGTGSDLKPAAMIKMDLLLHEKNAQRPLISKLLENETYKKMYIAHALDILDNYLVNDKYLTRARELQQMIRPELAKDANWFYTMAEFDQSLKATIGKTSKIPGIAEVMKPRADYLRKLPELLVLPPRISQVHVQQRERLSAVMVNTFRIQAKVDGFPRRVRIFYRFDESEPFREAAMADDGNSHDEAAGDGIYGAEIVPFRGARFIEYYIFAENALMVSYSPARYMYELHKTSLDELNQ